MKPLLLALLLAAPAWGQTNHPVIPDSSQPAPTFCDTHFCDYYAWSNQIMRCAPDDVDHTRCEITLNPKPVKRRKHWRVLAHGAEKVAGFVLWPANWLVDLGAAGVP